jgi:hypothetical protein
MNTDLLIYDQCEIGYYITWNLKLKNQEFHWECGSTMDLNYFQVLA